METWGCEFLDDGNFGRVKKTESTNGLYLPIEFVHQIADQRLVAEARLDFEACETLRASIGANGLQVPGVCYIDESNLRFQDGYHRLVACTDLGYLTFPVLVIESPGIKAKSMKLKPLVVQLLETLYQTQGETSATT